MGNGEETGTRAHIGRRRISLQGTIQPLMHAAWNNGMALAGLLGNRGETRSIIGAEVGEFRPARANIRLHFGKFRGIAHRPDGGGLPHAVTIAPPGLFCHLAAGPSGVADGHHIRAAAARTQRTAIVKTDDDVGEVDEVRNALRQLPISDNHDPSPHAGQKPSES